MNSEHTVLHGAHKKKLKTEFEKELIIAYLRQKNIDYDRDYPPNSAKQDKEELNFQIRPLDLSIP